MPCAAAMMMVFPSMVDFPKIRGRQRMNRSDVTVLD